MADDQAAFRIDGSDYAMPQQDTLTMDEAIVIYDYSALTLDQVAAQPGHPKVMKALLHIAYARGHPDMPTDEVSEVVGRCVLIDVFGAALEDDAIPPAEANSTSGEKSSGSTPSSGDDSSATSATSQANGRHDSSGTPVSAMPPISVPSTLES